MPSPKDATGYLSLSDAIHALKSELVKADERATDEDDALLEFVECEIELALEFQPKAEIGFNIGVFSIKTGADVKGGHKVKVKYKALRRMVAHAADTLLDRPPADLSPPRSTKAP